MPKFSELFFVLTALLFANGVVSAQTVTEANLLSFLKGDPGGAKTITLIQRVSKIDLDLSLEGQAKLAERGVPPDVLDALVKRQEELSSKGQVKKIEVAPTNQAVSGKPSTDSSVTKASPAFA